MIKANVLRQAILDNFDKNGYKKVKWTDIAAIHGTTADYVQKLVKQMRKAGLLPESPLEKLARIKRATAGQAGPDGGSLVGGQPEGGETGYNSSLGVLDGIVNLPGAMPRDERIRELSRIARMGQDLAKIQAMTKLEEMERAAGSTYGPPPPTTKADTIALVLELVKSLPVRWQQEICEELRGTFENPPIPLPETHPEAENSADDSGDSGLGGRTP